jgi:hypothetical protein
MNILVPQKEKNFLTNWVATFQTEAFHGIDFSLGFQIISLHLWNVCGQRYIHPYLNVIPSMSEVHLSDSSHR